MFLSPFDFHNSIFFSLLSIYTHGRAHAHTINTNSYFFFSRFSFWDFDFASAVESGISSIAFNKMEVSKTIVYTRSKNWKKQSRNASCQLLHLFLVTFLIFSVILMRQQLSILMRSCQWWYHLGGIVGGDTVICPVFEILLFLWHLDSSFTIKNVTDCPRQLLTSESCVYSVYYCMESHCLVLFY